MPSSGSRPKCLASGHRSAQPLGENHAGGCLGCYCKLCRHIWHCCSRCSNVVYGRPDRGSHPPGFGGRRDGCFGNCNGERCVANRRLDRGVSSASSVDHFILSCRRGLNVVATIVNVLGPDGRPRKSVTGGVDGICGGRYRAGGRLVSSPAHATRLTNRWSARVRNDVSHSCSCARGAQLNR